MNSESPSFRSRIASAGFWSIGGFGFCHALRLAGNLIMTRLLAPEMFGIMAVANVLMVGLAMFSDFGLNQNIIHSRRGDDLKFLNTIWIIQILRGLCLWLIGLIISFGLFWGAKNGWLADSSVYADPVLPFVLAVISFTALISGFNSTKLACLIRQLAQKQLAILEIFCQIVGLATMIVWARFDRSVWALMAGNFAGVFSKMVLSHIFLPGHSNRWQWDRAAFGEIFRFGKWIFLSSIIGFLLNNGDRLLLGGLVDSQMLGVYFIAYMLFNTLNLALSRIRTSIVFPALSEVARDRRHQLKDVYYKFRFWLDTFLLLMSGFFFITGGLIVQTLYDERYAAAGPMFQGLSLVLVSQRYALAHQCYLALGKPNIMTALIVFQSTALFLLIPIGFYFYGINGSVGGIVLSHYVTIPVSLYFKYKYTILDIKKELSVLYTFFVGMAVGGIILWIF